MEWTIALIVVLIMPLGMIFWVDTAMRRHRRSSANGEKSRLAPKPH